GPHGTDEPCSAGTGSAVHVHATLFLHQRIDGTERSHHLFGCRRRKVGQRHIAEAHARGFRDRPLVVNVVFGPWSNGIIRGWLAVWPERQNSRNASVLESREGFSGELGL